MALTYSFTCPLPYGMHARPASALEEVARPFAAAVSLTNERTGQTADAKSVLGIAGLDIRHADRCRLDVEGNDERAAFDRLRAFLEREFPHCDDQLPPIQPEATALTLPPALARAGAKVHAGVPVVPGIGIGRVVTLACFHVPASIAQYGAADPDAEIAAIDGAIGRLIANYEQQIHRGSAAVEVAIVKAHRAVARDPEFFRVLRTAIHERGATAAGALAEAETRFATLLVATGNPLLVERALDIRDVCTALLREVYGEAVGSGQATLAHDAVCVADSLTPGEFLALDRHFVKGLVLAHGGTTSHTVILARSFGIPTVVGVEGIATLGVDGQDAVVDADLGALVTSLTDGARRYYRMEKERLDGRARRLARFAGQEAATSDGRRTEIAANVGTAEETSGAFAGGAEGIGLFRTEMLFLDRAEAPSEDEQFEEYRRALVAAGDKPVIIRTLDVGGDKPIPYLRLPSEANPFLGYRAVRLYPEFESMFRTQVRALIRASAFGCLRVMVPMVSAVDQMRWVRRVIAEEQAGARTEGIAFDDTMPVGVMIEVPSLAFVIEHVSAVADFFSIGTNDLLQYFAAIDRTNAKIASLSNAFDPAFLRLLEKIVSEAHARGRWTGLCGEMGGQLRALPLLVGLGFDEISMASPAVLPAKAELALLSSTACRALLEQAMACRDAGEVEDLLRQFEQERPAPLLESDAIVVRGTARTKEEAIKEAVDLLYVTGRTDRPREVEDAVWRREAVYSTGFGHGFAIPHCKTDALRTNSLALVKLETPVEWGSLDDKPVRLLILLAIRESDQATAHMKVLAALARKVMHEDFRAALEAEDDPQKLAALLRETLGL